MLAAYAQSFDPDNPLAGLVVGERPEPEVPDGWSRVHVRAAALNQHDIWSLRGVGLRPEQLPMVLGADSAGVDDDGNEVVVHAVIPSPGWKGDETYDPKRTLLSELHQGTMAEQVVVPRGNLVPKPAELSFEEAACLPVAWLTAYRMLFTNSGVQPGGTILVQGAGGGVATALVVLASAAGYRVWVTSRDDKKGARAVELGADQAFPTGARLPERVDAVMETVGAATWDHSFKAVRPGGRVVVAGATSGRVAQTELARIYFTQVSVIGSTMGNRDELARLSSVCARTGVRPVIDRVLPLSEAREGFAAMASGELFGKVVFRL